MDGSSNWLIAGRKSPFGVSSNVIPNLQPEHEHLMKLIPEIQAAQPEIQALRRDIHAHPELCFEEQRTSDLVAAKLAEWGIEVHRGLGKTGLVGVIRNGEGKSIGLRADMDALPLAEANQFEHRSKHDGKMHACGHDGHTAMLLGAAHYLSRHRNFSGTVNLIFQPAEEGGGGAREMIKDGLFDRFPVTPSLVCITGQACRLVHSVHAPVR